MICFETKRIELSVFLHRVRRDGTMGVTIAARPGSVVTAQGESAKDGIRPIQLCHFWHFCPEPLQLTTDDADRCDGSGSLKCACRCYGYV